MRRVKDPDSTTYFTIDWSVDLGTDTISLSDWSIETGITEEDASFTDTTATIWVSGGTLGTEYLLTNRIVTAGGMTLDKTFPIIVGYK